MMRYLQVLIILLCANKELYAQDIFIESKALHFFVDSIKPKFNLKRQGVIWCDGVILQDTIDKKRVEDVVIDGFLFWKMMSDKRPPQAEWIKLDNDTKFYKEKIKDWETIIPNINDVRLNPVSALKWCKKLKFGDFVKTRYNLRVYQSFKFQGFNWVKIQIDKSDYEFGYIFYFKIDDKGNVLDWCYVYWIQ